LISLRPPVSLVRLKEARPGMSCAPIWWFWNRFWSVLI